MNKMQNYAEAGRLGASFVANVIMTSHRNPSKKLRGLVLTLRAGSEVRCPTLDILLIDGEQTPWQALEFVTPERSIKDLRAMNSMQLEEIGYLQ